MTEMDELQRLQSGGRDDVVASYMEGNISFLPTYKFGIHLIGVVRCR